MHQTKSRVWFNRFAKAMSRAAGRPMSFLLATGVVLAWLITGPLFGYSDSWQLVINTSTTIITFLMVFLIQNTQYRDAEAVQVKLDELLRATLGAHNVLLGLEDLDDEELERIHKNYTMLAERARQALRRGEADTDVPELNT
ncbi:MAG: low affinity iron permease family protein [Gemmatimonadota bacterium]